MFACQSDQTCPLTSCLFFSSQRLNIACDLCLFGYLFCSSLRLNSQSSRDKVPAPRLAPHVFWNKLVRHVLLGPHPLNPGLTHLFIEPSPHHPPPITTNTSHHFGSGPLLPSGLRSMQTAHTLQTWFHLKPCLTWIMLKFLLIFNYPSGQVVGILMKRSRLKSIVFFNYYISNKAICKNWDLLWFKMFCMRILHWFCQFSCKLDTFEFGTVDVKKGN